MKKNNMNRARSRFRIRRPAGGLVCLFQALESRCLLTGTVLDPTFGAGGISTAVTGAAQIIAQGHNTLVVTSNDLSFNLDDFTVTRFTPTGAVDATFGNNGTATTDIAGGADSATSITLEGDDIVVAGISLLPTAPYTPSMAVVRYTANGVLDTSFGNGGIARLGGVFPTDAYTVAYSPSANSILVAGSNEPQGVPATQLPDSTLTVARFTSAGILDTSFGTNGVASLPLLGDFAAHAMATDIYGNIVLAGGPMASFNSGASLVRLSGLGALDTTFGTNGFDTLSTNSFPARTLVFEADGSFATAVSDYTGTDSVYHLTSAGTLDTAFGTNGVATVTFGTNRNLPAVADAQLAVNQSVYGSDLVLSDLAVTHTGNFPALFALTSTGSLDSAFGTAGAFYAPGTIGKGVPVSIAITGNGNILQAESNAVQRVIPNASTVTGIVFNDLNENLNADAGEPTLSGWTVFADVNGTGVLSANDPVTTTDGNGVWWLYNLPTQQITFIVVPQAPFVAETNKIIVNVLPGTTSQRYAFPVTTGSAIAGTVTLSGTTTPASGATVYIDKNANGVLDSGDPQQITGSDGTYRFGNLPAGIYSVRLIAPAADAQTTPINMGAQTVTITGAANNKTGINFTVQPLSTITGTLFQDIKGAGNVADEVPFLSASDSAYIDLNNDGLLDDGESAVQCFGNGHFVISAVAPGTYTIRQVFDPALYVQTIPANNNGVTVTVGGLQPATFSFANFTKVTISGSFKVSTATTSGPVPLNTPVQIAFTPSNGTASYTQTAYTDVHGNFSLARFGPGSVTVTPTAPAGNYVVTPASESIAVTNAPVSFVATANGVISGKVFSDDNGNGVQDANELPLGGVPIFLNVLTSPASAPVQTLSTTTNSDGTYSFSNLLSGDYVLRETLPASFSGYSTPLTGTYAFSPLAGGTSSGNNFADRPIVSVKQLTGPIIGTSGSYKNDGNTAAKAFDGNLSTYFDGPSANGNWVGLDLGASGGIVTQIKYASRSGWASRMNGGIFQASNSASFASGVVNLFTIPSNANPPSSSLTAQTLTNKIAYRYYRYLSPSNSYGDASEVQFFGTAGGILVTHYTRLTGTTIGTAGSYQNKGNTAAKAFDGNLSTFFDGPTANGNWVGLDLGQLEVIQQITFAPRSGYGSRMVGGIIQASTTADFSSGVINIYTITNVPTSNQLTTITLQGSSAVQARYFRYLSPANSYGDIAELAFYG